MPPEELDPNAAPPATDPPADPPAEDPVEAIRAQKDAELEALRKKQQDDLFEMAQRVATQVQPLNSQLKTFIRPSSKEMTPQPSLVSFKSKLRPTTKSGKKSSTLLIQTALNIFKNSRCSRLVTTLRCLISTITKPRSRMS